MTNFFTQSKTINIWNFWLLSLIYFILGCFFMSKTSSGWSYLQYAVFPVLYFFLPMLLGTLIYFIFCQFQKRSKIIVNTSLLYLNLVIHTTFLLLNSGDCYSKIRDSNFIQRVLTGQSCHNDVNYLWVPARIVDILFCLHLFIYFVFIIYSCVSVWRKDKLVAKS